METRKEAAHEILEETKDRMTGGWITYTVFKDYRDRFGHEATYPTEERAQHGADALTNRTGYETRIIPGWRGSFRVQYRIKEGGK